MAEDMMDVDVDDGASAALRRDRDLLEWEFENDEEQGYIP